MIDTADLKTLIAGLRSNLKALQADKDLFVKAQGLDEEAEKLKAEDERIKGEIEKEKANLAALVEQKNAAMSTVTGAMVATMNEVLPAGTAVVNITESGECIIGWDMGRGMVSYSGLSGGEKASFDPALCRALGGSILFVEAAELDEVRLSAALEKYAVADLQVIVGSCHEPASIPEGWQAVRL